MGGILDLARRDSNDFITGFGGGNGFDTEITFKTGSGDVIVYGRATKHHMSYDESGQRVSSKNAQVTVNESDLVEAGISTRNSSGEVSLRGTVVSYADSTQTVSEYVVTERFPNETLGHIVLILGDYEQ